jgi:hypothetical protein
MTVDNNTDIRISHEIPGNLSSSQILELLKWLNANLAVSGTLIPLKAILTGIKTNEIIEHASPVIVEMFESLLKQLRGKHASEDLFEIYFLALELSDTLATALYNFKVAKRASKYCKESTALFPVKSRCGRANHVVTMLATTEGSRREYEAI